MRSGDRADHPISSEACPEAQGGRRDAGRLGHIDPTGLQGPEVRHIHLAPQIPPHRTGLTRTTHQGDLRETRAVWLSARPCAFAPRWLEDQHDWSRMNKRSSESFVRRNDTQDLQRVRASTAQQASEASAQGKAQGRPPGGGRTERRLGDGLRSRPARDRQEAAHSDRGRHPLALLPRRRRTLHLSRRRCSVWISNCSWLFSSTNRIVGRDAASAMPSASRSSFLCAFTYGRTYSGGISRTS